ncbi:MAG: bifunctional DNA-formamidopyrimidine glycosylase/DNA-(apurinic or apyrimidinic site) lyase [Gammaproteobacteria bacterium]|nr:bifunctional DNA-formamidopyrimidine glycosylase/DNA-(apurinic or apyrimidinic site) lyase [Gammaproteobacteria bacterium]
MPELPEVETVRRGIAPRITGCAIARVVIRQPRLRLPVPEHLSEILSGQFLDNIGRRGKYLLLRFATGTLILHLGMSGSLRLVSALTPPQKHDHIDFVFDDGICLRYRDPRRFGAIIWTREEPLEHPLLASLGPEPLEEGFTGKLLYRRSRRRRLAVKQFLMDNHVVVGVGNIYANESLFMAGILPGSPAGRISLGRYERLAIEVKRVLADSITQGGTTLRDFVDGHGNPGYFKLRLKVYGKEGEPCEVCEQLLTKQTIGQRSSFFCSRCQS